MPSKRKNKVSNEAIIKETLMTLSEEEIVMLILTSPKSLTNLCTLLALEEQLVKENKIFSIYP
jgi:hypothetical protein